MGGFFPNESIPVPDASSPDWHGYPIDECYQYDQATIAANDTPMPFMLADLDPADIPDHNDPREWHKTEDQGPVGSCQGHALSSVVEYAYRVATEGKVEQFSRQMGYIGSQIEDGIRGDRGSTLSGGMKLVTTKGLCFERTCPYPGRYSPQIPQEAWEEARDYIIRSSTWLKTYDDLAAYLYSGAGGIEIGIRWTQALANSRGVIESFSGGGGGGHAISFLGWSRRKDAQGRRYLYLVNSHSERWGDRGVAEVAPRAIESMLADRFTSCMGLSDLDTPMPRRIDFLKRPILA